MQYRSSFLFLTVLVIGILYIARTAPEVRAFQFSAGGLFDPPNSTPGVRGVQLFDNQKGLVRAAKTIYITDDAGSNWRALAVPVYADETIGGAFFLDENTGSAVLADVRNAKLSIAKTSDGGISWVREKMTLRPECPREALLEDMKLTLDGKNGRLTLRLASSSNFTRQALYATRDGGISWDLEFSEMIKNSEDVETAALKENDALSAKLGFPADERIIETASRPNFRWLVTQTGHCESFKAGCAQTDRLYRYSRGSGPVEITPAELREVPHATLETAESPNLLLPNTPGGNTRISLNRGFDKCTAATVAEMATWWNASWFYDANIYISGRNRACSQPQLSAAWVNAVSTQGWGLIPTIVGYQSPCSACTTCAKHSSDAAIAETQGRGEADIAIADAGNIGLTAGTVLYYDMERYDETVNTPGCRVATTAFLKGWTDRLKELGYVSGVYGSPTNAVNDWISIPIQSRMDAVWLARWDNVPSVWSYAPPSPVVPQNVWANHQRIKQWQGPHNETWGGITFNIDGNIADGPVAGINIARNKAADFDGDGKTDVSVWRPETGVWYVANSSNGSYTILGFGLPDDRLAPGDFDFDGKTDFAVWRPGDGVWHIFSRSIYRSYSFGAPGDIPVPADYDGDGRTDLAVFRPSTGVWYIWNSFDSRGTSYTITRFGLTGDKPVPGDYDADGKADIAVWRPGDGNWYLLRSSEGFTAVNFGIATDQPAQADFDGDGRTDPAVYRAGVWYLLQSQAGFVSVQFGTAEDKPSVGDFDGDGRSDIAVFRPSSGAWYILGSQSGVIITQLGISTDRPVPNAYLPSN